MTSQFSDMTLSPNFLGVLLSLVKFSYWSMFHVNIITGSRVIIFFHIGLTRNLEIPPSQFCPISGDWVVLEIPNFARMSLIKCAKCQGNMFYRF